MASSSRIPKAGVLVGAKATSLERFAANELCGYLERLFALNVTPTAAAGRSDQVLFLLGSHTSNPGAGEAAEEFAALSDQGILLKKIPHQGRPAMVVGGGSAQAVLWAVYELAERWGVCFLADRDILPEKALFSLPDGQAVMEPQFRIRAHPSIQDFAASGECWGFDHFKVLIDQLAKLKFNRLCLYTYGWQPFLHWSYKGVERCSATLWYDYRYHITPDTIGLELFGDAPEFWNPDLPFTSDYKKLVKAGIRLMRRLIAHAKARGMECVVAAPMTDFPPEFAPLLPGAERSHQLGGVSIVPGQTTRMDDRNLAGMAEAVLDATVETYPGTDRVTVFMPEFRQWTGEFEKAWKALDAKYRISEVLTLEAVLAAAKARGTREGDPAKVVNEVKADITSLYFYDKVLRKRGGKGGKGGRALPEFLYWGPVEELFPILDRILPESWQLEIMPTNHPATLLKRVEVLSSLPSSISASMALTIDDDNIGVLPQLTTGALHRTVKVMKQRHWAGFTARQRYPTDHDVPLAYLARVAWSDDVTPEGVAADVVEKICGSGAVKPMLAAFVALEKTTEILSVTNFGFPADWPIPTKSNPGGMLFKHMVPGEMPAYMPKARAGYLKALALVRQARGRTKPAGLWYVEFWIGRLEFAVAFVECVQDVQRIANAQEKKDHVTFTRLADRALEKLERALKAYVPVVRSRTDVGAIAVVNEHCYRQLKTRSWAYHAHGAGFLQQFL